MTLKMKTNSAGNADPGLVLLISQLLLAYKTPWLGSVEEVTSFSSALAEGVCLGDKFPSSLIHRHIFIGHL